MQTRMDLVGKTISGIVAAPGRGDGKLGIWMLQFTDGTHVEFVSPGARRALQRTAARQRFSAGAPKRDEPQLMLNVA